MFGAAIAFLDSSLGAGKLAWTFNEPLFSVSDLPGAVSVLPPQNTSTQQILLELVATLRPFLEAFAATLRKPAKFMLTKEEAAEFCSMSVTTYTKYVKLKLLPPMNETGRVCVSTLQNACHKLDGIVDASGPADPAELALAEWKGRKK